MNLFPSPFHLVTDFYFEFSIFMAIFHLIEMSFSTLERSTENILL